MSNLERISTKNKILDQAELAYATNGMTDFTLRTLTELADVNLASINYHFKSKQALIEAMLVRVLNPLCDERVGLLCRLQAIYGANLQPTHVLSAVLLPLIRELTIPHAPHRVAFLRRVAADMTDAVRGFLSLQFGPTGQAFDDAFMQSASHLSQGDAIWRVRLFCNALPGSVANYNLSSVCAAMLENPTTRWRDVLVHFSLLVEAVMMGNSRQSHVVYLIEDMLESLSAHSTVRALMSHDGGITVDSESATAPASIAAPQVI